MMDLEMKRQRLALVDLLREKGVLDEAVLEAIALVPRHELVLEEFLDQCYEDIALPIAYHQTISQPYTVAYMTALLGVKKHNKVLEIGTGSGYQAAILAVMGAKVFSVERMQGLFLDTKKRLDAMGLSRIKLFWGDGYDGLVSFAPFDRIIITAGLASVPLSLKMQLNKDGGVMVVPVGGGNLQRMCRITRMGEDVFEEEVFDAFKFVPFLNGVERAR